MSSDKPSPSFVDDTSAGASPGSLLDQMEITLSALSKRIATLSVLGMLIVASITLASVLMRWIAGRAIPGLNEIVEMIFAVAISACIPAGIARGVHLKIDLIFHLMSGRQRAWLDVLGETCQFVFFGVLSWSIFQYASGQSRDGITTVILGWPEAPFMFAVAALLLFGTLIGAVMAINATERAWSYPSSRIVDPRSSGAVFWVLILVAALLITVAAVTVSDPGLLSGWAHGHVGATVLLGFAAMWLLALTLIPLAAIMAIVGVFSTALFIGWEPAIGASGTEAVSFLTDSQVTTLPLFLMMGSFAAVAGISEDVYRLSHIVFGRFRGSLALATIAGCAGFGCLTGSSMATAVTIGRVALPEMRSRGYSPAFSTGCCAAGGTLGALLPPASGPLILFALLSEASIGQLFVAAIVPGLLAVVLYLVTVALYLKVSPNSAPVSEERSPGELVPALKRCGPLFILFGSILGGIYSGIFTATEAAAVGAVLSFLCALMRGKLRGRALWDVMAETTATTALIYGLIFGAQIFSFFVGISAFTESATAFVTSLQWPPFEIVALIVVAYLLLGSVMESFAVLVITVPIVTPLVLGMGFDLRWWGIINICIVETGLIHPPLGLNVFVLKNMQPDVSIWTIYKGVAPFVVADLVKLAILMIFPGMTLWLAGTMK